MAKLTRFATTVGCVAFSVPAAADPRGNCAPHDAVLSHLADKYGETRRSIGLDARGALVEVFASDDSGSWTITLTSPDGVTCMIASGASFETLAEKRPQGEPG